MGSEPGPSSSDWTDVGTDHPWLQCLWTSSHPKLTTYPQLLDAPSVVPGARIHLATLTEQLRSMPSSCPAALAVVGSGRPYASGEIAAQFGLPVWLEPLWDAKAADVLSDGAPEPRRFHDGAFMGRARAEAKALAERLTRLRAATDLVAAVR